MLIERFKYHQLSRVNLNGKRHYECPGGSKVVSVTSVLSATKSQKDMQSLNNWKKRTGYARAAEITTSAASRGTRIHDILEHYMVNGKISEPGNNPYAIEGYKMANHIIGQGLSEVTAFYGAEVKLYYPELYAGTTDCIADYKGELAVIDFKQTNKPKKTEWVNDYFLQLAAYILAHNILYDTNITQGIIMMCDPNLTYQEWILTGDKLEEYKQLWWNRLYEYYSKY